MADMAPPCSVAPACLPPSRRRLCAEKRGRPARRACFGVSARFSGASHDHRSVSTRGCAHRAGEQQKGRRPQGRRPQRRAGKPPPGPRPLEPEARRTGSEATTAKMALGGNASGRRCQLNQSHLHLASPFTHHKRSRKSHPQGAAPAAEARRAALRVHRHRQVGEHALVAATSTTAA